MKLAEGAGEGEHATVSTAFESRKEGGNKS